jgi:hypothetical protein
MNQEKTKMRQKGKFIFYHRTNADNAQAIVDNGFKNSSGYFLSNRLWTGVWLSSIPVYSDSNHNDALLMVKLELDQRELSRWEWTAEGGSHREWLVPAGLLNRWATVELLDELDVSPVAA